MVGELSVNRRTCQLLIAVRTAGSDQLDQRVPAPRDQGLERSDHPAMEDLSGRAPTSILEELAPEQIIEVLSHFQLFKRLPIEPSPFLQYDHIHPSLVAYEGGPTRVAGRTA
jgi:hypothetical protein